MNSFILLLLYCGTVAVFCRVIKRVCRRILRRQVRKDRACQ